MSDVRETGYGVADPVADEIWAIRMPLGAPDNPSVLCYVVLDAERVPHLIDSGVAPAADALVAGLGTLGLGLADIRSVTLTHLHGDHVGLADAIRSAGGATVTIHGRDAAASGAPRSISRQQLGQWGVPADDAAVLAAFTVAAVRGAGAEPHARGRRLPLHPGARSPGRAYAGAYRRARLASCRRRNASCSREITSSPTSSRASASAALPTATRSPTTAASLERVRELDGYRALPGHGWAFDRIAERIDETLAHHGRRTTEVAAALAREPGASVGDRRAAPPGPEAGMRWLGSTGSRPSARPPGTVSWSRRLRRTPRGSAGACSSVSATSLAGAESATIPAPA